MEKWREARDEEIEMSTKARGKQDDCMKVELFRHR